MKKPLDDVTREEFGRWLRERSAAFRESIVETSTTRGPDAVCAFQYVDDANGGTLAGQTYTQGGRTRYALRPDQRTPDPRGQADPAPPSVTDWRAVQTTDADRATVDAACAHERCPATAECLLCGTPVSGPAPSYPDLAKRMDADRATVDAATVTEAPEPAYPRRYLDRSDPKRPRIVVVCSRLSFIPARAGVSHWFPVTERAESRQCLDDALGCGYWHRYREADGTYPYRGHGGVNAVVFARHRDEATRRAACAGGDR